MLRAVLQHAATDRYLLAAGPTAANPQQRRAAAVRFAQSIGNVWVTPEYTQSLVVRSSIQSANVHQNLRIRMTNLKKNGSRPKTLRAQAAPAQTQLHNPFTIKSLASPSLVNIGDKLFISLRHCIGLYFVLNIDPTMTA